MSDVSHTESLKQRIAIVIRARLMTTVVDAATGILIVRLLQKREVAVLMLLLLVHETLKQIATLGFPESVLYFFEKWGVRCRRAVALRTVSVVAVNSLIAGACMLLLAATSAFWLSAWSPENASAVQRYLPWMALLALCEWPTWPLTNVLIGLNKPRQAGRYEIITSAILLASIILPAALGYGLHGVMVGLLAYGAMRLMGSGAWLALQLPRVEQSPLPQGALREQARFAVPLGVSALTGRLNKYADRSIVALLLPAAAFADYTVATTEIPFINAFPYGAASVLIGRYVMLWEQQNSEALLQLWRSAMRTISLLIVPVGVLLILSAQDLIVMVFGNQYRSAVLPFQIFCGIILLRVANYGSIVQAFGHTTAVLRITLITLLSNIVLNVPMTLAFGVSGTAASTLLATLIGAAMYLHTIAKQLEVPWWKAAPMRAYILTLLIAATCGGGALMLRILFVDKNSALLGATFILALGSAAYVAIASTLGVIRREDLRNLGTLLGRTTPQ